MGGERKIVWVGIQVRLCSWRLGVFAKAFAYLLSLTFVCDAKTLIHLIQSQPPGVAHKQSGCLLKGRYSNHCLIESKLSKSKHMELGKKNVKLPILRSRASFMCC